jgi:hypothetical protein
MTTVQEMKALRGSNVYDHDGEKIGKVQDVYSHADGSAAWIGLGTGFFGSSMSSSPSRGSFERRTASPSLHQEIVKEAPEPSGPEQPHISPTQEQELLEYIRPPPGGIQAPTQQFDPPRPGPRGPRPPAERPPQARHRCRRPRANATGP